MSLEELIADAHDLRERLLLTASQLDTFAEELTRKAAQLREHIALEERSRSEDDRE